MVEKQFAVIYNQFHFKSVITAAIIQTHYYNDFSVKIYNLANVDESINDYPELIILGCDVQKGQGNFYGFNKYQKRHDIHDNIKYKNEEISTLGFIDPVVYAQPSMLEFVAGIMGFSISHYRKLDVYMSQFHQSDATIQCLAYVYSVFNQACEVLRSKGCLEIKKEATSEDVANYYRNVKRIKQIMACGGYNSSFVVLDKKKKVNAIVTHANESEFIFIHRLICLAKRKFMNIVLSANGPMIYTNLPGVPEMDLNKTSIVLN